MNKILKKAKDTFVADGRFSSAMTAVLLAILIAANGIVYALTSYFGLYFYSGDLSDMELSDAVEPLFEQMEQRGQKVEILFCMAEEDLEVHDTGAFVLYTAKQIAEKYSKVVSLEYMNILTKRDSKGGNRSELVEKYKEKLEMGETLRDSSVVFTYTSATGQQYYRTVSDNTSSGFADFFMLDSVGNAVAYCGEEFLASMCVLTTAQAPKVAYFTQYHGEVADVSLVSLLICAGYEIGLINLKDKDVPENCDLLVISAPQTDFEKAAPDSGVITEIERLSAYVENGGHLLVTTHSYLKNPLKNLDAFLASHGMSVIKEDGVTATVRDGVASIPTDAYTLVADYADGAVADVLKTRLPGHGGVALTDTAALKLSGKAKPLLHSSASATLEADGKSVNRDGSYVLAAMSEVSGGGDIVLIPSVYLTATDAMTSNTYSNRAFIYGLIEALYGGERLPYGCHTVNLMMDMLENLTARAARIYTAVIFLIPTALAVGGFVFLRRRRNR